MVVEPGEVEHEFERPGRIDLRRPPAPVGAGLRAVHRPADPLAGIRRRRDSTSTDAPATGRLVGTPPGVPVTRPLSRTVGFRRDRDPLRLAAGDEFVDLAEGARMERDLAMIERAEHQIGGALSAGPSDGDAGRRARLADEAAVGLGVFVDAVAAQRQERGARRHFAVALVQPAQERAAAVELAAETRRPSR